MGPASIAFASFITDTEKSLSPAKMALSIGEAPRYRGKREGWIFKIPAGSNAFKADSGIRTPNDASTPNASGCSFFSCIAVPKSALLLT